MNNDVDSYLKEHQEKMDKLSEICGCPVAKVFLVTEDQMKKADELIKKHQEENHQGKTPYGGAIGGIFSWTFSETSLGQTQGIKCAACGEYLSLTDFSDW